ncbi:hypothetical protein DL89DRAFT_266126 [Linderina pennispora]|uniref:Uncharacterized protein n=1 Tax=Linderina pennispora TaxID=61395 RepID=A0A1Y1WD88_9FUNG|nr:uncharacterized protein DL89DRAFT_266126 [Linderina pennispora]ORX71104.1 hypothetical protein DL89DRAFT_266126 [Linderina pennispora]
MTRLYQSKCCDYDELEAKHNRFLERRKTADVVHAPEVSDNNQSTSKAPQPHSEPASAKRFAETTTSLTKRRRTDTSVDQMHSLFSSSPPMFRPVAHFNDKAWQRKKVRAERTKLAPCAASSQTTQMDASEANGPVTDSPILLCPSSDEEEMAKGVKKSSQPHMKPQNGCVSRSSTRLEGGCEGCRMFYDEPGFNLTKEDLDRLCTHKKGKTKLSPLFSMKTSRLPPLTLTRSGAVGKGREVADRSRLKGDRPLTPEHFWDIDYFPPIRTAGPDTVRKQK